MKIDAQARERLEALQQRCLRYVSDANMQKTARWLGRFLRQAETPEPTPSQEEAMEAVMMLEHFAFPDCEGGLEPSENAEKALDFIEQAGAVPEWRDIETAPPSKPVLIHYRNGYGKSRVIKAAFVPRFTEEATGEEEGDWFEENEKTGLLYVPQGWYEQIDNWGELSAVHVCEGDPDCWMPLPPAPKQEADYD